MCFLPLPKFRFNNMYDTKILFIYARNSGKISEESVIFFYQTIKSFSIQCYIHQNLKSAFKFSIEEFEFFDWDNWKPNSSSLIVTLGGDGTLLDVVPYAIRSRIPVFGFHLGKLGFLTSMDFKSPLDIFFKTFLEGAFNFEFRNIIQCHYFKENGEMYFEYCLNEAYVLRNGENILQTQCIINREVSYEYFSDGVIVSTPTGSTGYSLSCGGSVVLPQSQVFLITPIACHQSQIRPIIIPNNFSVELISCGDVASSSLFLDGKKTIYDPSKPIRISIAEEILSIARIPTGSTLESILKKLF